MEQELYDVTVIGAGPAGLYSTFYSGLREMKTKLIECQPNLGGKLHVYPEKIIWDVGGQTPILGEKLIDQLVEQALTFNPTVVLNEKIMSISRNDEGLFYLYTDSGDIHYTKAVIIAVGGGVIKPQKLKLEGAEKFEVSNLHYTVKSIHRFTDKIVMISGGGNSAIDWANSLEPVAKKVYVAYRKESLTGHESQVSQLLNSSAQCYFQCTITNLLASENHERIEQVELTHQKTGEITKIAIDEVVINHGYDRDMSLLENSDLGLRMVDTYYIAGNANSETSIDGIYAAGDILNYDGKVHLITGAFQDAANAVNKAKQFIQPNADKFGMVSSHNDLFSKRNQELVKQMRR